MIETINNGKFVKSLSGNPAGRPCVAPEVRELARAKSVDAIHELDAIMRDVAAPYVARIQACNSILDRAWGKAVQHTENANLNLSIDDILTQPEEGNPFAVK
jgi:hypothetical protein